MEISKTLLTELMPWIKENKTALGYAFTGGTMAVLRCIYRGESFKNTCAEGGMCALVAFGISEILTALDLQPELAFPASVFLGYVGISSIMKFSRLKSDMINQDKK
ncbi:phage holin family protein [Enterobacter sp. ECC-175]|nr:phage holin, lambda family [Enterobacter sp. RIT 418]